MNTFGNWLKSNKYGDVTQDTSVIPGHLQRPKFEFKKGFGSNESNLFYGLNWIGTVSKTETGTYMFSMKKVHDVNKHYGTGNPIKKFKNNKIGIDLQAVNMKDAQNEILGIIKSDHLKELNNFILKLKNDILKN